MKKSTVLLALLLLVFSTYGQEFPTGDLTITSTDGQRFYFYLDDLSQNSQVTSNIMLYHLVKGIHKASFRFENENIPATIGSVYINPGMNSTYALELNNYNTYSLRAVSIIPLNKERHFENERDNTLTNSCAGINEADFQRAYNAIKVKPFDDVRLTVAKEVAASNPLNARQIGLLCKAFNFDDSRLEFAKYAYPYCCDKNNYYLVNNSFKFSGTTDDLAAFISSQPIVTTQDNHVDNDNRGNRYRDNDHRDEERREGDRREGNTNNQVENTQQNTGCVPMDATNFEAAGQSIFSKSFDDTKLQLAKSIVQSNCLTADQIAKICHLFGFESSKLDFAKFAYPYCYDKNNYFKVNDVFDFESSVTELTNYIKTH